MEFKFSWKLCTYLLERYNAIAWYNSDYDSLAQKPKTSQQQYMTKIYFGVNKKSKIYTSLIPELIIVIIGDSNNFKMFVSKMDLWRYIFILLWDEWSIVKYLAPRSKIEETKTSISLSNIFHNEKADWFRVGSSTNFAEVHMFSLTFLFISIQILYNVFLTWVKDLPYFDLSLFMLTLVWQISHLQRLDQHASTYYELICRYLSVKKS